MSRGHVGCGAPVASSHRQHKRGLSPSSWESGKVPIQGTGHHLRYINTTAYFRRLERVPSLSFKTFTVLFFIFCHICTQTPLNVRPLLGWQLRPQRTNICRLMINTDSVTSRDVLRIPHEHFTKRVQPFRKNEHHNTVTNAFYSSPPPHESPSLVKAILYDQSNSWKKPHIAKLLISFYSALVWREMKIRATFLFKNPLNVLCQKYERASSFADRSQVHSLSYLIFAKIVPCLYKPQINWLKCYILHMLFFTKGVQYLICTCSSKKLGPNSISCEALTKYPTFLRGECAKEQGAILWLS